MPVADCVTRRRMQSWAMYTNTAGTALLLDAAKGAGAGQILRSLCSQWQPDAAAVRVVGVEGEIGASVLQDHAGSLWLTSNAGVARVDRIRDLP